MPVRKALAAATAAALTVAGFLAFGPGRALPSEHHGVVRIDVDGGPPQEIAYGAGAVWVLVGGIGSGTIKPDFVVWRIDAETNAADPLPATRGARWVAAGERAAWVTVYRQQGEHGSCTDAAVLKLDAGSGSTVAEIPVLGEPSTVSVAANTVWVDVAHGANDQLLAIDPTRAKVTGRFDFGADRVFVARGALWISGKSPSRIARIDPATGAVLDETHVGTCALGVGGPVILVATCGLQGSRVTRIDPSTGDVLGRQDVGESGSILWDGRWMRLITPNRTGSRFVVERLEPRTGMVLGLTNVDADDQQRWGYRGIGGPATFAAFGGGSLWISDFSAGQVIRLLPGRF